MREFVRATVGSVKWSLVVGVFLAAVIKLEVSLALKLILLFCVFAVYMMHGDLFRALVQIHEVQCKILFWLRATHISVESKRLDTGNQKPAQEILAEDLEIEKLRRESMDIGDGTLFLIVGAIIVGGVLVFFWDQLVALLP